MLQQFLQWVRSLFGKKASRETVSGIAGAEKHKKIYESTDRISFDAVFAGQLANKAVNDCEMNITDAADGESRRSAFVAASLDTPWRNIKQTVAQALGKGGKFLIPYVSDGRVYVSTVDQSCCSVNEVGGDGKILSMSIAADMREVRNELYWRIVDYDLIGRTISIKTRAVDARGNEVNLGIVSEWADITPEIIISNVDRMLAGFSRCPKDSRKEGSVYGVPITYGCEDTIRQLYECMEQIEKEYSLKRVFVGVDELLFGKGNKLPQNGLFKKFQQGGSLDGKSFYEVYDPAIRDSSYYARYNALCAQLEKEVGTSKGILTEPATFGATATEIKSANHDTYCLVSDIRKNIQDCFEDLAYSVDVYAEYFGLTPVGSSGDYKVTFDWDTSLTESSSETFNQLSELESRGLISGARLNSWVTGQSMEDAQAEIDAVQEQQTKAAATILEPGYLEPTGEV